MTVLLRQMLYRCEIRFLPIAAEFWIRKRPLPDYEELIRILCERMLDPKVLRNLFDSDKGRLMAPALEHLIRVGGIETAESFEALFGPLRVAGIDRIHREKLWKSPVSRTEDLWYRAMIFRENRFISDELKECYILPDDLKARLAGILSEDSPSILPAKVPFVVRPASPSEAKTADPPDRNLIDIITLEAAAKREDRQPVFPGLDISPAYIRFLEMLLKEMKMFPPKGEPDTERIRNILTSNRTAAQLETVNAWRMSESYDELAEDTEHLNVEISPDFDKKVPRGRILDLLSDLESDTWWSLNGFTAAIKREHPNFLRNSFGETRGRICDIEGNDLSGIGAWFQLEGAYIQFMITGPLTWLGIVQTASSDGIPTAFRISSEALFYLSESASGTVPDAIRDKPNLEHDQPNISTDGAIVCTDKVPRYFRYMAARCCVIEKLYPDRYVFRLTPGSLAGAERSGISGDAFLKLLRRFSGKAVPPSLERLLSDGNRSKLPATIYNATILSVPDAGILEALSESTRAGKWIIQRINDTSLLIDPKGIEDIRRFLMEKEIFVDVRIPRT